MVAISCGTENFEIQNVVSNVCTFKAATSRFKVYNVRSYPARRFSA